MKQERDKNTISQLRQRIREFERENRKLKTKLELAMKLYAEVRYPINSKGKVNYYCTYCYSCGTTVKDQKYCHGCGRKLKWQALKG